MSPVSQLRWHYTVRQRLDGLLRDGVLPPATAGLPAGERPAVWFSSNQQWEETANQAWQRPDGTINPGNKEATHLLGGGLARIGVLPETAPHDWKAFKALSGIKAAKARGMYDAAIGVGARPGEWFVSFEPVPRSQWVAVEVWDGERWLRLETGQSAPAAS
jgi:hypothetical protein